MNTQEYKLVSKENEKDAWDKIATHPMQSWAWGSFRSGRQKITRIGKYENGKLCKVFLVVWTKIKYTPFCVGYIPMGAIPSNKDIEVIKNEGKRNRAIFIRIEPNFIQADPVIHLKKLARGRSIFKPKTFVIDLTKSEEELLDKMHPKARYNIKVANKHGVVSEQDNSESVFREYINLMFEGTVKRQGIKMHEAGYHREMWKTLQENEGAFLWTATYQGKVLAADIIFKFHDWIYYAYGATALEHKEVMAPTQLLWEIIKWGKRIGAKKFDLWGAEEGSGFSRFKEQFGGDLQVLPGSFDIKTLPWLYPIFRFLEEVRWRMLHMLK